MKHLLTLISLTIFSVNAYSADCISYYGDTLKSIDSETIRFTNSSGEISLNLKFEDIEYNSLSWQALENYKVISANFSINGELRNAVVKIYDISNGMKEEIFLGCK